MSERRLFALLNQLWRDLGTTEFYWLTAAVLAILAVSWGVAFRLRGRQKAGPVAQDGSRRALLRAFGAGGLKRVAFPAIALCLVWLLHRILLELEVQHLALLTLVSLLLLSWLLVRSLVYILRCVFPQGGVLKSFERLLTFTIWGGMLLEVTDLSDSMIDWLEAVKFTIGKQKLDLWMLLHGSVTIGGTLLIALWLASLVEQWLMTARRMDANLREVLARLAKAFLSVVALLFSLSLLGIDVTALSVFSGALAVGLGFGLQKIASNYVSGFIILLDRSIRLGNMVMLDDATTGRVTRITTRYTVLRTPTGTEVIIPNEYLVSNMVRNLSFSDNLVRVATTIGVAYDTDIDRTIELLKEIAAKHPRVLAEPGPGVALTSFGDSSLLLELGFWIRDPENGTGNVRSEINLEILRAFRANGIEIPFPQREVRVLPGSGDAPAEPR